MKNKVYKKMENYLFNLVMSTLDDSKVILEEETGDLIINELFDTNQKEFNIIYLNITKDIEKRMKI